MNRFKEPPLAGPTAKELWDENLELKQRIAQLETLLRRSYKCMCDWQDPMVAPFERILNDIDATVALGGEGAER